MDEFILDIIACKDKLLDLMKTGRGNYGGDYNYVASYPLPGDFNNPAYFKICGCRACLPGFNYSDADAVIWQEGYITIYPLQNKNRDAISFNFTGCSMVRFSYNNSPYIAHIQSSDSFSCDRKRYWIDFVNENRDKIRIEAIFRPVYEYMQGKGLGEKTYYNTWGVITKEKNCYTVHVRYFDAQNNPCTFGKAVTIKLYAIYQQIVQQTIDTAKLITEFSNWDENNHKPYTEKWNQLFTGAERRIYLR